MLGSDGKPVYAPAGATPHTKGPAQFAQWFNDTPGINLPFTVTLALTETTPGRFRYDSAAFFPIDNMGYGNSGIANDGLSHNFHFTTEIHTTFTYQGGEVFTFNGDDDLWLFINERLAIDLGGVHATVARTIALDELSDTLNITPGGVFSFALFFAERHSVESNFSIETTISEFAVCPP
jgi:fibro-slime domain-containing protein